jgi:rSAM/selenodomain-associated transferase 2
MPSTLSIIIPVLNEAGIIVSALSRLQSFRAAGHEIIVVDGGSNDGTPTLSEPLANRVISSPRGRAHQMNAGAEIASGGILLFLHADTLLPENADRLIFSGMARTGKMWGRFDASLSGKHCLFPIIASLMNLRSRIASIATADQAIFVERRLFEAVHGFPEIDLMEDIAMSKILKRTGKPLCLWHRVLTSSRRWEKNGILRTVLQMWFQRLAYFLGVDPRHLARCYNEMKER